ncbi:MAG: rRNA maturation RNase YbeY [Acidobacteriota bacterium]
MDSRSPVTSREEPDQPQAPLDIQLQGTRRAAEIDAEGLRCWMQELVSDVAPQAESFGVRFVSDEEMAEFNRKYRGRSGATDVLSFPGDATSEDRHLGDVVIAVPWVRRQAMDLGVSLDREIRTLLLHGILHCLGFDHETDRGEMDEIELRMRARWIDDVD